MKLKDIGEIWKKVKNIFNVSIQHNVGMNNLVTYRLM